MKIYLYLNDKIVDFSLPEVVDGSFKFDNDENEKIKLINIEARNGEWYIYSTKDVKLFFNNNNEEAIKVVSNNYYVLKRNDINYLIYITDIKNNSMKFYKYTNDLNLIIGNSNACNFRYKCDYLSNCEVRISFKNDSLVLENVNKNGCVYLNNKFVPRTEYGVKNGDQINIFNLKLIFLPNLVLVNDDKNIELMDASTKLVECKLEYDSSFKDIEIIDENLYQKEDYFSKAPRIRRFIESKTIKLSPPPKIDDDHNLPMILTIGPMMTMGIMSAVTLVSTGMNLVAGTTTVKDEWPGLVTSGLMIISIILWPILTRNYNNRMKAKNSRDIIVKYKKYLEEKRNELEEIKKSQREIILENLISIDDCVKIIQNKDMNLWSKRIEQNDFLAVRIGIGNEKLDVKIEYPEEGFTIEEDELRKQADKMVDDYRYIENMPVSYSFYNNKITAVMGNKNMSFGFITNIILQLLTFYSYEDLKIVVFTNEENDAKWDYLKFLNHNFSNDKGFRFFASGNDSIREVSDYLNIEVNNRLSKKGNNNTLFKPHYFIIVDDYEDVKRHEFIKNLTENDDNIGFNIVILEERLSKLPSKCNNFITLGSPKSGILRNSYEKQEQITFISEINYNVDMMKISKILANIPIEFEEGNKKLPEVVSFLEMERVGKVEQLNVLSRWNDNDSTVSLKTEIGLDEQGNLMYLDLHEKAHGPHGLVAGTTGSGKSEFIITYIISMAINYSPDDVSFILIDYKGGGLALAFENKYTGVSLPHLAGIITNLDKAELDRTLVSINSELERRQKIFNQVRHELGESTIDIYKYQRLYHEGRINIPISHLFIVCDEFAELKAQQPDFMENLISVARIGRSLGVHLILATQKPSGVVNEQIWSNTRFRICFKVQEESDSREMLKRPEAARLKETGRFYMQVGYDEYFSLGQSAWCGTKYYPSDTIIEQVDRSINFINDNGGFIKSIQASNNIKVESQGEQLSSILNYIIEMSKKTGKTARKLWLDDINEVILVDDLEKKYNIVHDKNMLEVVIGEYDAPEMQKQGPLLFNYLKNGNTIIYGNDGSEKEHFLNTLIYATTKNYSAENINFYIIDYGSESLRKFKKLPHVGGVVFATEEEKYNNLIKMLSEEIDYRKDLFAEYGGEYSNYIKQSSKRVPLMVVIINNYDSFYEANNKIYDQIPELVRDSERYGVIFIITANNVNSVHSKISSNCPNMYTYKLKDLNDYSNIFGIRVKNSPKDVFGRGLFRKDTIHEFQTASIIEDNENLSAYLINYVSEQMNSNAVKARRIPILPEVVEFDDVKEYIKTLNNVPIGIYKDSLEVANYDYLNNLGNIIASTKIINTTNYVKSLIKVLRSILGNSLIVIDAVEELQIKNYQNYYVDNFDGLVEKLTEYFVGLLSKKATNKGIILIYGVYRFINRISDVKKFNKLVTVIKQYEKYGLIIVDDYSKIKGFCFDSWFVELFNINNGLWIGKGITEQNLFRIPILLKDMSKDYENDMAYIIESGMPKLCKLINFSESEGEE